MCLCTRVGSLSSDIGRHGHIASPDPLAGRYPPGQAFTIVSTAALLGTGLSAAARAKGSVLGVERRKAKAAARAADLAPVVAEIKASGRASLRAIAAELDVRGIPAPRGGNWTAPAVMRLLSGIPAYSPAANSPPS